MTLVYIVTARHVVRYALYFQLGWCRCVSARELYLSLDRNLTSLTGRADEDGGRTPLYSPGIGIYRGIANDFALTLDGEAYVLLGQTAHMAQVVSDLTDYDNEVGAVGYEFAPHLVGIETQFGATARRHFLLLADYLAIDDAFCQHLDTLPVALGIAVAACLEEVPDIRKHHYAAVDGQRPAVLAAIERQAHAVAVGEDGDILIGELCQLVGDGDDGCGLRGKQGGKHILGILRLPEGIVVATPVGVRMVAALMVEGVPLATADELTGGVEQFASCVVQAHGLDEHGALAPGAGGTVQVVVGIPVVDQFAKLAGEDRLTGGSLVVWEFGSLAERLEIVAGPAIDDVVIVHDTSGMHIGSSYGTIGIGVFVTGNLQCLQGEVFRIACLVEDGFPHQHAGMVAVAADNLAGVLMHLLVPTFVLVPVLPTGGSHNDKESQFVAGIHERGVLRVVCHTDDIETTVLQTTGITPMLGVRHGIAHIGKVLMAVGTNQLVVLPAIEIETRLAPLGIVRTDKLETTDTYTGSASVEVELALPDACTNAIEVRRLRRP